MCTNDRELYERALIYCHLHRPGALDELTNPVYKQLDAQLLGWKWRAHPLAMAIGLVSLESLPYRIERVAASRDELAERTEGLPGIELAHNYRKAKGSEIYGGLRFLYDADALDGLPASRFVEAVAAEGAPLSGPALSHMEHLRALYTKDLPGLWGEGHPGPANVPLPRYHKGDFPISESLSDKVLRCPSWIEPAEGFIAQFADALGKVVEQRGKLM